MMSEETLNGLAKALKISPAYVHQAASFYHYSNLGKDHLLREGTCGGPACCLPGVGVGRGTPGEGIACPGLCDQAPATFADGRFRGTAADPFLPPPPPADAVDGVEEVLFRGIRTPGLRNLDVYRADGGYAQLRRLVEQDADADALETLRVSGLLGRGGAGFPSPPSGRPSARPRRPEVRRLQRRRGRARHLQGPSAAPPQPPPAHRVHGHRRPRRRRHGGRHLPPLRVPRGLRRSQRGNRRGGGRRAYRRRRPRRRVHFRPAGRAGPRLLRLRRGDVAAELPRGPRALAP